MSFLDSDPRQDPATPRERRDWLAKVWAPLPNFRRDIASYEFMTHTIRLNGVTVDQWKSFESGNHSTLRRLQPILNHERLHWLDHIGTNWGYRLLEIQYKASSAKVSGHEEQFHTILELTRYIHASQTPVYYTECTDNWILIPPGEPWKQTLSCGVMFNQQGIPDPQKPIPMIRFRHEESNESCRLAVNALALLEVRAIAAEIATCVALCRGLGEDEQIVERADIERKFTKELQYPLLVEYNLCASIVKNLLPGISYINAFLFAARAAGIALNMTETQFNRLKIPEQLREWGDRNASMAKRGERGFAFLAIIFNAVYSDFSIDSLLKNSNLSDFDEFMGLAAADALNAFEADLEIDKGLKEEFLNLVMAGADLYKHRDENLLFSRGQDLCPPVILEEDQWVIDRAGPLGYDENYQTIRLESITGLARSMFAFQRACAMAH